MVRSTNTGISVFVSATGDVDPEDRLGLFEEGVLVKDVPLVEREATLYAKWGHWFPWLAMLIAMLGWFGALMRPPPLVT